MACYRVHQLSPLYRILLSLCALALVGCDRGPTKHSVYDVSWDDVRHWSELADIVGRRDEIDEVVITKPDHENCVRGIDVRAILNALATESTCPIIDLVSRKKTARLVLRSKGTDVAEIQCYDGNVYSFKNAYIRASRDVLGRCSVGGQK